MNVVFVSSEVTPYASTGGLAEVAAALPKALAAQGIAISRIMPLYRKVAESGHHLVDMRIQLHVPVGFRTYRAEVWKCDDIQPTTYFIRRDEFFDRSQLYSLPDRDYDDNFERFVFFQKAAVALIDRLELKPDIVHCNDWQTGLVPYFLRHGMQGGGRAGREKVVFTIHNLAYQGIFPGNEYPVTNLPFSCFSIGAIEFFGNINCLKAGLTGADRITTVSETYAREIQSAAAGCGLEGVLQERSARLRGIVNGIDADLWNPADDRNLASQYSAESFAGKQACREHLCARMRVHQSVDTPILGMVTRLVDQKGLDILAGAMPEIMKRELVFVLLGTGSEAYEKMCAQWMRSWPGKFGGKLAFDPKMAHRIFAGSDMFIMPSRFEPCGLNQLYAMRYGSVPIVHAVGGLDDTVVDVDARPDGFGFKFRDYTSQALLAAVDSALAAFRDRERWSLIVRRAMQQDFSWRRSSAAYADLYRELV